MDYPPLPIDSTVLEYAAAMSWLHGATSRPITLLLEPVKSGCPNHSGFNFLAQQANSVYNSGNPYPTGTASTVPGLGISGVLNVPFADGEACPVCNGDGFVYGPTEVSVSARIKWTSKATESTFKGVKADVPQADVRIKVTGSYDCSMVQRCRNAHIDGVLCSLQTFVQPVGLRDIHTYVFNFNKVS